jgi:hypothetical protein
MAVAGPAHLRNTQRPTKSAMRREMHISPAIIFEQALAPGFYAGKVMQMTIAAAFVFRLLGTYMFDLAVPVD